MSTLFKRVALSFLRWRLIGVPIAVVMPFCAGATSAMAVESGPHYAQFFGQSYRTKTDLYVFIFNTDTDHVYIGSHARHGLTFLPETVARANIGQTFGSAQILEVLPAGSILTLLAETHETLRASGIRDHGGIVMGFIARATHESTQFEGVLTEFIQTAEPAPPRALNQRLDPSVVELLK